MEGGSHYCNRAPICTEERKENIDPKTGGEAQTTGYLDFSSNVSPSKPVNSGTEGLNRAHSPEKTKTENASWSCWCAKVNVPPPRQHNMYGTTFCLVKKQQQKRHCIIKDGRNRDSKNCLHQKSCMFISVPPSRCNTCFTALTVGTWHPDTDIYTFIL